MKKDDKIKGGKADRLSIKDIAEKHDVSIESIKDQIDMGKGIEMEHVNDKDLAEEIAMDHLEEMPDYYTRLKKMEKEAKKELSTEAKRFMALAGIKEGDKKFLTNESFTENQSQPKTTQSVAINNKEAEENNNLEEAKKDDLIVHVFEQVDVEPGEDDHKVYKIRMPKKD